LKEKKTDFKKQRKQKKANLFYWAATQLTAEVVRRSRMRRAADQVEV
jgi:hypothetical protein